MTVTTKPLHTITTKPSSSSPWCLIKSVSVISMLHCSEKPFMVIWSSCRASPGSGKRAELRSRHSCTPHYGRAGSCRLHHNRLITVNNKKPTNEHSINMPTGRTQVQLNPFSQRPVDKTHRVRWRL